MLPQLIWYPFWKKRNQVQHALNGNTSSVEGRFQLRAMTVTILPVTEIHTDDFDALPVLASSGGELGEGASLIEYC